MAEIAVPIALLGGMYILSNQESKKESPNKHGNREGFNVNRNNKDTRQRMSSNLRQNMQGNNFPINGKAEIINDPNYYPDQNHAMSKYFEQATYEKEVENDTNQYKSLTGNMVQKSDLKHNNMVPFFGSKVRHGDDRNVNESRLDNMVGSGSQHFRKREQAPLFKPEENVQWGHGMPNATNFIQSRMNPSMSMANVKPFQEIRVGPGLSEKGGVLGSGGFNAGMESRETWAPKTVDELRVKSNPKVTYGGVVLGGKNPVTNRGILGNVEKYRPDTYYINGPERYMTTTGIEKAQTARSIQVMPEENRETTSTSYYGVGDQAGAEASYVPGTYMPAKRPELDPNFKHVTNAHAANKHDSNSGDHGIQGYKSSVLPNNRSLTTTRQPEYGAVSTFAKAIVAPIMDMLRPSRKENVVGNIRPLGNAGHTESHSAYVYNPNDKAKTTIREMTEQRKEHQFVNNQRESGGYGYLVNKKQSVNQERDTTSVHYSGNAGSAYGTEAAMTYDSAYNAHLINKEPVMRGRNPMGSNVKMFNGQSHTNIKVDKLETDRLNNRMYVPQQITKASPAMQQYGQMSARSEFGQNIHTQRNSHDILNAFRSNPYAKPLDSVA
jgi:hypothetical protein